MRIDQRRADDTVAGDGRPIERGTHGGLGVSVKCAIVLGAPRSGTTFLMSALSAHPALECVSGNLLPVGIAHLGAQDLPDEMREALQRSFRGALDDYLATSLYHARTAAVR